MKKVLFVILIATIIYSCNNQSNIKKINNVEHKIFAEVYPKKGEINVTDTMIIPIEKWNKQKEHSFYLNKGLKISSTKNLSVENNGICKDSLNNKYTIKSIDKLNGNPILILKYSGKFFGKFEDQTAEYARGFNETNGVVSDTGIYLSSTSCWLPQFNENYLSTFDLKVKIPKPWKVVSGGKRTILNDNIFNYNSTNPLDDIFLIANKWAEFDTTVNNVLLEAFLIVPDTSLANKYLSATAEYMQLYEKLIGEYPYSKFALVENFWQTGYGMPSFTLLGSQIIRFPWIIYSSYPHELLHNYWGNSVFVDDSLGNWCEGITAYMADHLMKEEQGQGLAYRQATLEKFTNYVNDGNDFPVKEFVNRNNSAQEAVGYGKVLMMNNMLRVDVGDSLFLAAYRKFYKDFRFKKASFADIEHCFEQVSGKDYKTFFKQWINRKGAPKLELNNVSCKQGGNKFNLKFSLAQTQNSDAFEIKIPVFILFDNDTVYEQNLVSMNKKEQSYSFNFDKRPAKLMIDPQFNVMRKLDKQEIPATLSQLFGQKEAIVILPSRSKNLKSYEMLANLWKQNQQAQGFNLKITYDNKIDKLPDNVGVWIIGKENKFNNVQEFNQRFSDIIGNDNMQKIKSIATKGGIVYTISNKNYLPVGFLSADNSDLIIGLSHRLLHYGKYSLLGFDANTGRNIIKQILPIENSPLNFDIKYKDYTTNLIAKLKNRKALSSVIK